MLIKLRKMMTNQKGFTLVELMVVIAIIGVLATIAIPKMSASTAAAKDGKLKADLRTVDSVIMMYNANNGFYPANKEAIIPNLNTGWPDDAKGTSGGLVYTKVDAGGYTLTGFASGNATTKLSPGSNGYNPAVAW